MKDSTRPYREGEDSHICRGPEPEGKLYTVAEATGFLMKERPEAQVVVAIHRRDYRIGMVGKAQEQSSLSTEGLHICQK